MAKRPRRDHASTFKVKIAIEAIKGEQTLAKLAQRFDVHHNQITDWKKQLFENADEVFEKNSTMKQGPGKVELHAKIGRLTMENDFLSKAIERINVPRAKR